jgi:hypothetical protein
MASFRREPPVGSGLKLSTWPLGAPPQGQLGTREDYGRLYLLKNATLHRRLRSIRQSIVTAGYLLCLNKRASGRE